MPVYRKRRIVKGPSKGELRSARNDRAEIAKSRAGTLRDRFPDAGRLEISWNLENQMAIELDRASRIVGPDDSFAIDIPCPSACGGGHFDLTGIVETMLTNGEEARDGLDLCKEASYADFRTPCGTKFHYNVKISYKGE